MIRRLLLLLVVAVSLCQPVLMSRADACPMCKTANETDDAKPRAYMYSILFMLGMPAMVFSGFGIAFYRLSRKMPVEYVQPTAQPADGLASDSTEV